MQTGLAIMQRSGLVAASHTPPSPRSVFRGRKLLGQRDGSGGGFFQRISAMPSNYTRCIRNSRSRQSFFAPLVKSLGVCWKAEVRQV